jgi:D-alanine-D-alanine ligase
VFISSECLYETQCGRACVLWGVGVERKKIRLAVLFGGRSGEHEVSLMSAASVIEAADKSKYEIIPIGIDKNGCWLMGGDPMAHLSKGALALSTPQSAQTSVPMSEVMLPLAPNQEGALFLGGRTIDVVFPVLHGTYGEDGTVQGLLEMVNVPYVGAGVAGSAVGMDKALMKSLFRDAGLPILDFVVMKRKDLDDDPQACVRRVENRLGYPCFVKPANGGSSVGVSKVRRRDDLLPALELATHYDIKVVIEAAAVEAREIEVSVLGHHYPTASVPGEIIPSREFYDYEAKYKDANSQLIIPAGLSAECTRRLRDMALTAFQACECSGLARVDFFVHRTSEAIWLNEINTMPGFTSISMYPKLWEATGLSYSALIDRLVELALERFAEKSRLKTSYE